MILVHNYRNLTAADVVEAYQVVCWDCDTRIDRNKAVEVVRKNEGRWRCKPCHYNRFIKFTLLDPDSPACQCGGPCRPGFDECWLCLGELDELIRITRPTNPPYGRSVWL